MLKPSKFVEQGKAVENVIQIIGLQSEKLGCSFDKDIEIGKANTMYFDTKAHELGQLRGVMAAAIQEAGGVRIQYWQDQGDNETSPANQWL